MIRAVSYSRDKEGKLQGTLQCPEVFPALMQFPAGIRMLARREENSYHLTVHLEKVFAMARTYDPLLRKAIHDDIRCLIATRFLVETRPEFELTKHAAFVFPDYAGDPDSFKEELSGLRVKVAGRKAPHFSVRFPEPTPWPTLSDDDYEFESDADEQEMGL